MARLVDVRAVVGVHLKHAANALLLVLDRVEHRVALVGVRVGVRVMGGVRVMVRVGALCWG